MFVFDIERMCDLLFVKQFKMYIVKKLIERLSKTC